MSFLKLCPVYVLSFYSGLCFTALIVYFIHFEPSQPGQTGVYGVNLLIPATGKQSCITCGPGRTRMKQGSSHSGERSSEDQTTLVTLYKTAMT